MVPSFLMDTIFGIKKNYWVPTAPYFQKTSVWQSLFCPYRDSLSRHDISSTNYLRLRSQRDQILVSTRQLNLLRAVGTPYYINEIVLFNGKLKIFAARILGTYGTLFQQTSLCRPLFSPYRDCFSHHAHQRYVILYRNIY